MKRVLITGKDSYIGKSFIEWLQPYSESIHIEEIDVKGESWVNHDFSAYDVVFHVAGIAHVSTDPDMKELYYRVNRDLTIRIAEKAKRDGVSQFIFMSSMIVYGNTRTNLSNITTETKPEPSNFYGDSKLKAEDGILKLETENFKIVILRPPMIYGKGSKGNYPKLSKLAQLTPIFPDYPNKRSMLHINNLTELIRLLIKNEESGIFFPQNKEYVNTSRLVKLISEQHKKTLYLTKSANFIINFLKNKVNIVNKLFGDLAYSQSMSDYKEPYRVYSLKESVKVTEIESRI